ncbi:protein TonB [Hymenobacter luteus]|uniref:Protein TonB n=2 Tax=Hymenobacter TaxID=89966 RepID=A0A7W9SZI3_9BACT|nr:MULTISPECIES: energy transducer TonB [Hymenobacter]MBB4601007.1 protein TonB [Hymenobacter latericoloratus]MBB6058786.1 protein TonB [Hymenobacter luteus]
MPHLLRLFLLLGLLPVATPSSAQKPGPNVQPDEAPAPTPAVYHVAEVMPAFPGGAAAFQKFLHNEVHYPDEALQRHVSGKVYVRFLVTEEGRIRDAEVVKGLGAGLDEEALRLVRIMPWWSPGQNAGRPVRVLYTMPIVFRALE